MSLATKKVLRTVGFAIGVALIIGAVVAIVRSAPTLDQLRVVVARPDVWLITWAVIATLGSLIGASGMFYVLVRPFGNISFLEMGKLIAASSVLNYLPMRPGLLGRIAHQEVVNKIPMRRSVLSIVEAAFICALTVLWLAVAVALVRWSSMRIVGAIFAALPVLCALAVLIPEQFAARRLLEAVFWRWIDLLCWTVRYWAVFGMLGIELSPESAATAACIAGAANMIPFLGNGLGVREWAIGLAGPALTSWTTDTGLAAELLNRCIDLVIVVPIGLGMMPGIAQRIRIATKSIEATRSDEASTIKL